MCLHNRHNIVGKDTATYKKGVFPFAGALFVLTESPSRWKVAGWLILSASVVVGQSWHVCPLTKFLPEWSWHIIVWWTSSLPEKDPSSSSLGEQDGKPGLRGLIFVGGSDGAPPPEPLQGGRRSRARAERQCFFIDSRKVTREKWEVRFLGISFMLPPGIISHQHFFFYTSLPILFYLLSCDPVTHSGIFGSLSGCILRSFCAENKIYCWDRLVLCRVSTWPRQWVAAYLGSSGDTPKPRMSFGT